MVLVVRVTRKAVMLPTEQVEWNANSSYLPLVAWKQEILRQATLVEEAAVAGQPGNGENEDEEGGGSSSN